MNKAFGPEQDYPICEEYSDAHNSMTDLHEKPQDVFSLSCESGTLALSPSTTHYTKEEDVLEDYDECLLASKEEIVHLPETKVWTFSAKKRSARTACSSSSKQKTRKISKAIKKRTKKNSEKYSLDFVAINKASSIRQIVLPKQSISVPEFHILTDQYYEAEDIEGEIERDNDELYTKMHGPREIAESCGNFFNMGQELKDEFKDGFTVRLKLN